MCYVQTSWVSYEFYITSVQVKHSLSDNQAKKSILKSTKQLYTILIFCKITVSYKLLACTLALVVL